MFGVWEGHESPGPRLGHQRAASETAPGPCLRAVPPTGPVPSSKCRLDPVPHIQQAQHGESDKTSLPREVTQRPWACPAHPLPHALRGMSAARLGAALRSSPHGKEQRLWSTASQVTRPADSHISDLGNGSAEATNDYESELGSKYPPPLPCSPAARPPP